MQARLIDSALAVLYVVAAISGGAGGCLVAAHHVLRGRSVSGVLLLAYGFAGFVFGAAGVMGLAILSPGWAPTLERVVLAGLLFGLVGAGSLAGMNFSARFLLRRLGIEVDVQVRQVRRERGAE